jgi:hypothetical protein
MLVKVLRFVKLCYKYVSNSFTRKEGLKRICLTKIKLKERRNEIDKCQLSEELFSLRSNTTERFKVHP